MVSGRWMPSDASASRACFGFIRQTPCYEESEGSTSLPARCYPLFENQKSTHPKMNCVSNLSHVPRFVQSSLNEAGSGEWALDAQRCECFTRLSANTTHQTPNTTHQTPHIKPQTPPLNIPPNHTPKTSNPKPHSPNHANSHPTPHTRW